MLCHHSLVSAAASVGSPCFASLYPCLVFLRRSFMLALAGGLRAGTPLVGEHLLPRIEKWPDVVFLCKRATYFHCAVNAQCQPASKPYMHALQ